MQKKRDDLTVRFHDSVLLSYQSRHQPNRQSVWRMCSWFRATSKRSHCKAALSRRWCCLIIPNGQWPKRFQKDNGAHKTQSRRHQWTHHLKWLLIYKAMWPTTCKKNYTVLLATSHTLRSQMFRFFCSSTRLDLQNRCQHYSMRRCNPCRSPNLHPLPDTPSAALPTEHK